MGRLKDKLIRWLGGLTVGDMLAQPIRPVIAQQLNVRTLKVGHAVRQDVLEYYPESYPEYMDAARKDMAYRVADEMLEEKLIEFNIEKEQSDLVKITAIAKIVVPMEVI